MPSYAKVESSESAMTGPTNSISPVTTTVPPRIMAGASGAPSWRDRHWFPVASTFELDPMRPTPVCIDGLGLVVWKVPETSCSKKIKLHSEAEEDDGWRVFADACPHRLAPLSEGRIEPETGNLQCAYHGWEFDSCGTCKTIPSADIETCERAVQMPRAKAHRYPSKKVNGIIWAWLGTEEPRGSPADLVKGTMVEKEKVAFTYTRDLHYSYDMLVENLIDPSHVPFAHHGLQGTRDDAKPIVMNVKKGTKESLAFEFSDRTMGKDRTLKFQLIGPFFSFYRAPDDDFPLSFLQVPISPGMSRVIILYNTQEGLGLNTLMKLPKWMLHIYNNKFLDSDLAFVHYQELTLKKAAAAKWRTGYFMPAKCDQPISAYRRWLEAEGALCVTPEYAATIPESPPRSVLLNRYEGHTQHCKHCLTAYTGLRRWQWRFGMIFGVSLAIDRLRLGSKRLRPLWILLQILSLGIVPGLQQVRKSFHFVDYEHYKR